MTFTPLTDYALLNRVDDNASSHSYREVGPGAYAPVLGGQPGQGSYISDTVTLGLAVIKEQVMASTWMSLLPLGLLGLAPPKDQYGESAGTFKRYPTLLSNLFSDNIISSPSFSLWFDPSVQDPQDFRGRVDFGVLDKALFSGKPVTLPVVANRTTALDGDPYNWNIALGSVAMASQPDDNAIVGRTVSCTIESGSTYFSFNNASYHKLAEKFPLAVANRTNPGLTFYQIPCQERYNNRNDIIFSLIDPRDPAIHFNFTVPSHQVIWPANLVLPTADPETCAINALSWEEAFAGSALEEKYECIIGSAALKSVYSVFDLNNLQISFATSVPRTGPPEYSSIPQEGLPTINT